MPARHNLKDYESKRRFDETPEPSGRAARRGKPSKPGKRGSASTGSFVIQRHDARRLHYDFRLELDGSLKSWAVPKGPSLDPAVKRLAVHVEDHPVEYGKFEGRIPAGSYGAGTVEIWDHGTWKPEGGMRAARDGYKNGKLAFRLDGEKLHGGWALVRSAMGGGKHDNWLLIKQRDEDAVGEDEYHVIDDSTGGRHAAKSSHTPANKAREPKAAKKVAGAGKRTRSTTSHVDPAALKGAVKASLPDTLAPQLATPADAPPGNDGWLYELKFDGYRVLARIDGHDVRIFTRSGKDWTAKFPQQAQALLALDVKSAWLDGEAVVLDKDGVPDFQALQNAFEEGSADDICIWFFDLPWLSGFDLRKVPLEARRAQLQALLQGAKQATLRFSEAFEGDPDALLQAACEANLEGLVAKREGSAYTSTRSASWLKLRCSRRQEFVIGGYTEPAGSRVGFGALLLGVYDGEGALHYGGRVGTGFDTARLKSMASAMRERERKTSPFAAVPATERRAGVHWLRPELVAEVRFKTWTSAGVVRQASFVGLRKDKPPKSIVREPQASQVQGKAHTKTSLRAVKGETEVAGIRITHPDRVIDNASGLRKIDLVHYFEAVAPWLLPHLQKRPAALVRAPSGVEGELFFQKHASKLQIPHVAQHEGLDPGHAALMTFESADAIVGAAQMDAIEFHTWNGLVTGIEKPDRLIFDLDPDPALEWDRMIEAAQLTRDLLDALGLRSWCKTSGGKGLHVVVPLVRHAQWDDAKDFARAVAVHMAATLPDRFSAKMGPKNRTGRIFVDYLRNGRGATSIAAYAPRARPGLGVSTPIRWDELDSVSGGAHWTVANLHERLEKLHADPWEGYAQARQRITAAMRKQLDSA
ncbi:DNA ligase D [Burkholderia sp. Ax-1719]|uniref:DNA ligase D n=1 Tax=Burkholderia sp. Ax-1719 TaxID=2608334 RepID=UPI001421E6F2|nr:DNA ligase D [Burkholderia sp. Ax-1719]NIE62301.1 DNA ligase D [Burkholderia sp. Ax-1719]